MVKSKMIWDGTGVAAAVKDIEPYFCLPTKKVLSFKTL